MEGASKKKMSEYEQETSENEQEGRDNGRGRDKTEIVVRCKSDKQSRAHRDGYKE
jgi:hypothetical protein